MARVIWSIWSIWLVVWWFLGHMFSRFIYSKFEIKESQKKKLWNLVTCLLLKWAELNFNFPELWTMHWHWGLPSASLGSMTSWADVMLLVIWQRSHSLQALVLSQQLQDFLHQLYEVTCSSLVGSKSTVPYQVSAYSLRTALRLPRSARDT